MNFTEAGLRQALSTCSMRRRQGGFDTARGNSQFKKWENSSAASENSSNLHALFHALGILMP